MKKGLKGIFISLLLAVSLFGLVGCDKDPLGSGKHSHSLYSVSADKAEEILNLADAKLKENADDVLDNFCFETVVGENTTSFLKTYKMEDGQQVAVFMDSDSYAVVYSIDGGSVVYVASDESGSDYSKFESSKTFLENIQQYMNFIEGTTVVGGRDCSCGISEITAIMSGIQVTYSINEDNLITKAYCIVGGNEVENKFSYGTLEVGDFSTALEAAKEATVNTTE